MVDENGSEHPLSVQEHNQKSTRESRPQYGSDAERGEVSVELRVKSLELKVESLELRVKSLELKVESLVGRDVDSSRHCIICRDTPWHVSGN